MERDLKPQLLSYLERIDRLEKQISALRQSLTKLLYRLPRDEVSPIKLLKGRIFSHKTTEISETLSSSPFRYKRRKKRLELDDFMGALEKNGMSVGETVHQMSYMIGAETGCKVTVNGDPISVFQYKAPLEWSNSQEAVANGNLMM